MILKKKITLMNDTAFGKIMENVGKYRDIKLLTTERGRNQLVSEPNYHTTNFFTEKLLAIEMKKQRYLQEQTCFPVLLILELSKLLMYENMQNQNQNSNIRIH